MKLHISWGELVSFLPELLPLLLPLLLLHLLFIAAAVISLWKKKLPFRQTAAWFAVSIFLSLVGPALYFAIGSKKLDEIAAGQKEGRM